MPTIEWPYSLPDELLVDGFRGEFPKTKLRTEMDAGPAKQRRRFTATVEPLSGSIEVTSDQLERLQRFHNTDCAGGASEFLWAHPVTRDRVRMRFVTEPAYSSLGGGYFKVDLSLEVMP